MALMHILTVNTGSSSVRLGLFEKTNKGFILIDERHIKPDEDTPESVLRNLLRERQADISAAAHRVVHGGQKLFQSCFISKGVEQEIDRLSILAPLHNPLALTWIRASRSVLGEEIPQIAVFDTAFYASMPEVSRIYALPKDLCSKHRIQRYGFHGIAHMAMYQRFTKLRPDIGNKGNIISIQLGSGCSMTALKGDRPIDTSMGFSPNEGLVMSSRSGDVDSGLLVYLQTEAGFSATEVDRMLNTWSGLLGVSGLSGDMKTLLASEKPDAQLAVELYCYRVRKYLGAYSAALGGIDAILFGGGVGENSPPVRKKILEHMEWCGIHLDTAANDDATGKEARISSSDSEVDIWVIPVDEAPVIAEEAYALL
jgi:acetate kinase